MELKYWLSYKQIGKLERSNRTFMELKFNIQMSDNGVCFVLIVPLWN